MVTPSAAKTQKQQTNVGGWVEVAGGNWGKLGVFEDGSEQKFHEERSSVQNSRTWVEVWNWFIWQEPRQECTCLQFVWKRGLYSRWESQYFSCMGTEHLRHQSNQLFDNISEGDIKGIVFQHNSEVYKFISAAVDLFDWFICWDL